MASERYGRGERERYADRNRDRLRTGGEDWRDEDEGREWSGREFGDYGSREREYGREEQFYGGGRSGRSGEFYGGRQGYGAEGYGSGRYRGSESGMGADQRGWSSHGQNYGYGGRESGGEYGREMEYGRRGAMGYGGYGGAGGSREEYGAGLSGSGMQQQHRGQGPRGYRRSDERIREDVCDRLTDDPQIDASNMEVTVKDGEITLSGTVNSREDKHHAEDIAESISGVKDVRNNIRVVAEQQQGESAAKGTTQPARH